jgi:Putative Actinobacterial Holin-X, holin superfamily III
MHIRETEIGSTVSAERDSVGVGTAAKQVAERASAIARLEMELAGLELKRKIGNLAFGIGLAIGAAVFALFGIGFGLAAVAATLAIFLDLWLALLIVFGGLLFVALVLGLIGLRKIKRGTPPVPEQAIEEAKRTTAVLKSNGA